MAKPYNAFMHLLHFEELEMKIWLMFCLCVVACLQYHLLNQTGADGQDAPDLATQNCDPPVRMDGGRFTTQWCEDGVNLVDTKYNRYAFIAPGERTEICAEDAVCLLIDNREDQRPQNDSQQDQDNDD